MPKPSLLPKATPWKILGFIQHNACTLFLSQGTRIKIDILISLGRQLAKDPNTAWEAIQDLPKAAIQILEKEFVRFTSTVEQCQSSADGTKKLLVRLQDGLKVESVIMVYDTTGKISQSLEQKPLAQGVQACACLFYRIKDWKDPCGGATWHHNI